MIPSFTGPGANAPGYTRTSQAHARAKMFRACEKMYMLNDLR